MFGSWCPCLGDSSQSWLDSTRASSNFENNRSPASNSAAESTRNTPLHNNRSSEEENDENYRTIDEWEALMCEFDSLQEEYMLFDTENSVERANLMQQIKEDPNTEQFSSNTFESKDSTICLKLIALSKRMKDLEKKFGLMNASKHDDDNDISSDLQLEELSPSRKSKGARDRPVSERFALKMAQSGVSQGTFTIQEEDEDDDEEGKERTSPSGNNNHDSSKTKVHRRGMQLRIKREWPDFLVDESYDVVKVNKYGKHYQRILRLTPYHILAASEEKGVTKVYKYSDLKDIKVQLQSADKEKVILVFKDNSASVYITNMAAHIAQQLTTRLKLRKSLDDHHHHHHHRNQHYDNPHSTRKATSAINTDTVNEMNESEEVGSMQQVIDSIIMEKVKSKSSHIVTFAECLVEKLVPSMNNRSSTLDNDRSSMRMSNDRISMGRGSALRQSSTFKTLENAKQMEELGNHLLVVNKNSQEFYVQKAISLILMEGYSVECRTRSKFIEDTLGKMKETIKLSENNELYLAEQNNASPSSSAAKIDNEPRRRRRSTLSQLVDAPLVYTDPDTIRSTVFDLLNEIRMWIEGMHEYILTKHGSALALIHIWSADVLNGQNGRIIKDEEVKDILDKHLTHKKATSDGIEDESESGKNDSNPLYMLRRHTLLAISYICYGVIEDAIYLPLSHLIQDMLQSVENIKSRDTAIFRKIKAMKCLSQEDWKIPANMQSPLGWEAAINEMNILEKYPLPSAQLATIVNAAKTIFAEHIANTGDVEDASNAMGADDLLPIFLYVMVQADITIPLCTKEILWNISHSSQKFGESGYYLTMFESAVDYLEHYGEEEGNNSD